MASAQNPSDLDKIEVAAKSFDEATKPPQFPLPWLISKVLANIPQLLATQPLSTIDLAKIVEGANFTANASRQLLTMMAVQVGKTGLSVFCGRDI
jgi:hypothetical protein